MPIIECPACSWAHPSLIAHCLRCNDTRRVLVSATVQPDPFPLSAMLNGIQSEQPDPLGDALRMLERAMRMTDMVVTISTRPDDSHPLGMGRYDLCVEVRPRNQHASFPRVLVELTPPSN